MQMRDDDTIFGAAPDGLDRLVFEAWQHPEADHEAQPTLSAHTFLEQPGARIGRYRLLSILGEGGMGIVYLAEQERPVKRQVALKVIKPGMDSKRVLARFEAEQQALALMEHPHIARVYDAGLAPSGRPYFVMEHVRGIPITEHCDKYKLTIEERLRLFLHVCEAVQHAHQKGIIHRDLKPSNILVVIQDEKMIAKVIDFGVARAISQPLTERTLYTEQGQLIGTPEYMSPEQADLSNQDVDTRTDVYSLGIVLYELLTGVLPFDPKALRDGGIDHIRKVICEDDPKTPSTQLSKTSVEESTESARRRQTDLRTLQRRLRGDLDWITLKALDKDRIRRYQTAHALAEDIERHLNNEPVSAGRPGTLYRFQKLVRRNKGVFAAAAVVVAALVLGAFVSSWQAVRATQAKRAESRQRQQAQANEMTARQIAYASDMSLAQQALAANDLGRARRLLEAHRPAPGAVDLRGWEWRYLWQECRSDALGELCRYPPSAFSVAYSPDGKTLAVAGMVREFVDIWDVPGRRRMGSLAPNEGHVVAFSPQGNLLAAGAGSQVRLWRTDTWDLVRQLALDDLVHALRFSRDGTRLASLSRPGEAIVWAVDQGTIVRRIPGLALKNLGIHTGGLDFSPDGKVLAIGDGARRLQAVDLATGDRVFDIPEAHPEPITAVAWSPNGSVIASGSGYTSGTIRLSDAVTGNRLGELLGHTSWIGQLVFSNDGLRLYSASADQTIRLWDVEQGKCLATLRGSREEVYGLALSPDGTTLASACKDGSISLWDARPRREEQQPRLMALSASAFPAFAPDSRVLALPIGGTVRLFDLAAAEEIEQLPALGTDVRILVYSPDGTLLVSGDTGGKVRVWSCAERRLVRELGDPNSPINPMGFRADGRWLLSGDPQGRGVLWDTHTWQPVRTFMPKRESRVMAAKVSPDGRLLAAGTGTGSVNWLDAATGQLLATRTEAHHRLVSAVAFSHDSTRAASVSEDGTLALWDTSSLQPLIPPFKGHTLGAHGVAFSADGRRLATGGNGREAIKLWDMSTGRELVALSGQGFMFFSVAFSPNGQWLAACNSEGQLHLWRAPSWAEIEAAEKQEGPHGPER